MKKYGIDVITEIDTPYHSECFRAVPGATMLGSGALDIREASSYTIIENIMDEYLDGDNPVIQSDKFHIGTDEYNTNYSEEMRAWTDHFIKYVNGKGYNTRLWASLGSKGFNGTTPVTNEATMNLWTPYWADVKETYAAGYDVINTCDWFYDYVYDVYVKELMTGLTETVFAPNNNIVRAQFAVIVYRMEGQPEVTFKDTFPDVKDGNFYSDAVIWAAENGIVTGYTNTGLFGPNDPITREQMAAMMFRYANYRELDTDAREDLNAFPDENKVQEFATDAVKWCVAEGIISGKGEEGAKILDPQGNTVRAEAATIISRYTEAVK